MYPYKLGSWVEHTKFPHSILNIRPARPSAAGVGTHAFYARLHAVHLPCKKNLLACYRVCGRRARKRTGSKRAHAVSSKQKVCLSPSGEFRSETYAAISPVFVEWLCNERGGLATAVSIQAVASCSSMAKGLNYYSKPSLQSSLRAPHNTRASVSR